MSCLLSIYIPTYNRCNEVIRQISFLKEEIKDIDTDVEIFINDNCSEDDTEQEVKQCIKDEDRIQYHRNETNVGIVGNSYLLERFVNGEYIWVISDDDVLEKGIVSYVLKLIEKYNDICYIYLNYADINTDNTTTIKYTGDTGFFNNAVPMIFEDFMKRSAAMMLTSTSIYKRKYWDYATKNLPLTDICSFGCSYYATLAAIKNGSSYYEPRIWAYAKPNERSWKDYAYLANMGIIRSFAKLNEVGYTKKEIQKIYKSYCGADCIGGGVFGNLLVTRQFGIFFSDWFFLLRKCPANVIKESCRVSFDILSGILRKVLLRK